MDLVEIQDIKLADSGPILAHHLDFPKPGSRSDLYAIEIGGWVLGRDLRAVAVEVTCEGRLLCAVPVNRPRDGVSALFPTAPGVDSCGFRTTLGMLGIASEFALHLRVVLANESKAPLGMISGRRQPLEACFQPRLQPIMVTALGRSGTTWLMRLLAEHHSVVAFACYPYEMRIARYLTHMLRVLSDPGEQHHPPQVNTFQASLAHVGQNPFYSAGFLRDEPLRHWFGRSYPERLAAFCQESIETFYQEVASTQNKAIPELRYFAEKHPPDHLQALTWELYPHAREIFLVRDFRDMICSILSFNAKRGFAAFGREHTQDDGEYIMRQRLNAQRLLQSWRKRRAHAHLVRYEDLVLHPTQTLRSLFQYLNLDSEPSKIQELLQRASKTSQEMEQHQTSASSSASIGRWRHELDASLQNTCADAFGDILGEFNYC